MIAQMDWGRTPAQEAAVSVGVVSAGAVQPGVHLAVSHAFPRSGAAGPPRPAASPPAQLLDLPSTYLAWKSFTAGAR